MRRQLIELWAEHPPEGKQPLDHPDPDLIEIRIVVVDVSVAQKRDPTRLAFLETAPLKLSPEFAFEGLPSLHQPVEEGLVPLPVGVLDVDLHAGPPALAKGRAILDTLGVSGGKGVPALGLRASEPVNDIETAAVGIY